MVIQISSITLATLTQIANECDENLDGKIDESEFEIFQQKAKDAMLEKPVSQEDYDAVFEPKEFEKIEKEMATRYERNKEEEHGKRQRMYQLERIIPEMERELFHDENDTTQRGCLTGKNKTTLSIVMGSIITISTVISAIYGHKTAPIKLDKIHDAITYGAGGLFAGAILDLPTSLITSAFMRSHNKSKAQKENPELYNAWENATKELKELKKHFGLM